MKGDNRNTKQKETLIKVLRYIKPYGFLMTLTILMAVISVVLTLYLPILTGDRNTQRIIFLIFMIRFMVFGLFPEIITKRSCRERPALQKI